MKRSICNKYLPKLCFLSIISIILMTGCQAHHKLLPAADRMANKHIQMGNIFYEKGRITDAIREWGLALELDPNRADLAEQIKAVESGKTLEAYQSEAQSQPVDTGARERIAQDLQKAKQYYRGSELKKAEVTWQRILDINSEEMEARAGLGRLEAERYQKNAEREFDSVVKEYYERGMQYYRKQKWSNAESQLAKAAQLAPQQAQVNQYLKLVRTALAGEQTKATVLQLRAEAENAEKEQKWLAAHFHWKKILELEPEDVDAKQGLERTQKRLQQVALKYVRSGQQALEAKAYTKALKNFRQALTCDPQNKKARQGAKQARLALTQGSVTKAHQDEAKLIFSEGAKLYRQGKLDEAISQWQKAVSLDPGQEDYVQWLNRARTEIDKQSTRDCQLAKTRYQDGLQAFQREDLEEALAAFNDVIELCPRGAEAEKAKKHVLKIKGLLQ